eukprot:jgi/Mesvir1/343/Mv22747-RA.1
MPFPLRVSTNGSESAAGGDASNRLGSFREQAVQSPHAQGSARERLSLPPGPESLAKRDAWGAVPDAGEAGGKEGGQRASSSRGSDSGAHVAESQEIKRGWLMKQRKHKRPHVWERRLFVLREDDEVRYFRELSDGRLEERGRISLWTLKWVDESAKKAKSKEEDIDLIFTFQGNQPHKKNRVHLFRLKASSVEKRQEWVDILTDRHDAVMQERHHAQSGIPLAERDTQAQSSVSSPTSTVKSRPLPQAKLSQIEVKRGWLLKKRHKYPARWERRMFVLWASGVLTYYLEGTHGDLKERGMIELRDLVWFQSSDPTEAIFEAFQSSKSRRRKFVLKSSSEVSFTDPVAYIAEWHEAISMLADQLHAQSRASIKGTAGHAGTGDTRSIRSSSAGTSRAATSSGAGAAATASAGGGNKDGSAAEGDHLAIPLRDPESLLGEGVVEETMLVPIGANEFAGSSSDDDAGEGEGEGQEKDGGARASTSVSLSGEDDVIVPVSDKGGLRLRGLEAINSSGGSPLDESGSVLGASLSGRGGRGSVAGDVGGSSRLGGGDGDACDAAVGGLDALGSASPRVYYTRPADGLELIQRLQEAKLAEEQEAARSPFRRLSGGAAGGEGGDIYSNLS